MKKIKLAVFVAFIAMLASCGKSFHERAEERYTFIVDSLQKDADTYTNSHYEKDSVFIENDSIYVRTFTIHWETYSGEKSNKVCSFVYVLGATGDEYELCKPSAFFVNKMESLGPIDNEVFISVLKALTVVFGEKKN